MEPLVYPEQTKIRLYELREGQAYDSGVFLLERCIGAGGSCTAYQATGENGIPVRLKQLCPLGLPGDNPLLHEAEERFVQAYRQQLSLMREEKTAAVTASLCGLYRDDGGHLWSSVNTAVGKTLDMMLPGNAFLTNLKILRSIAESVRAYHEAGWLLLDLKPANILVIDSPGIQGINFFDFDSFVHTRDLKKAVQERSSLLLSSTAGYSAPELQGQYVDVNELGPAADRYSIGAILFDALFGTPPELLDCVPSADFDFSVLAEKMGKAPVNRLSEALTDFLRSTLSLTPEARFPTDEALIEALDKIIRLCVPHISLRYYRKMLLCFTAILTLLFLLLFFTVRKPDTSPVLHLTITPGTTDITEELHDTALLLDRLHMLGFHNATVGQDGQITASGHASALGEISDLRTTLDALLSRHGVLYAFGIQGQKIEKLAIAREDIVAASGKSGAIDGLDRELREASGLPEQRKLSWLSLCLSQEAAVRLSELKSRSEQIRFGLDLDYTIPYGEGGQVRFALALPGEDESTWTILDGRWTEKRVYAALAALLTQKELSAPGTLSVSPEPAARWQTLRSIAKDVAGRWQRDIRELPKERAVMYFQPSDPDSISDNIYEELMRGFRARMDVFGVPYALGSSFFREREIAVCISPACLSRDIVACLLPAFRLTLVVGTETLFDLAELPGFSARTEQRSDGSWALRLFPANSAYAAWLLQDAAERAAEKGEKILLCTDYSNRPILSALPGSFSVDGSLLFDGLPLLDLETIPEDDAFLPELCVQIINTRARLAENYKGYYYLNTFDSFLTDSADFGIKASD